MNLSVKQKQNYRCRKQTYECWGVRKGAINWEIGIDMYTLLCIKQIANKDLRIRKDVKLYSGLCDNLKGKTIFKSGDICIHMTDFAAQQKITQRCKSTILSFF